MTRPLILAVVLSVAAARSATLLGGEAVKKTTEPVVECEDVVYSGRYSNNGSCPMWCFSNTCIARLGDDVFASGYERALGLGCEEAELSWVAEDNVPSMRAIETAFEPRRYKRYRIYGRELRQ